MQLDYVHNSKSMFLFTVCSVHVWMFMCVVGTVSPPPQQVEEDEDYVQVDHEGSVDVFLWIQAEAHHPHHQLTVHHQELS